MLKMSKKSEMDEDIDNSSGSDFDEDEDPDKIEVPGGGKDLASAAGLLEPRDDKIKKEAIATNSVPNAGSAMMPPPPNMMHNAKMHPPNFHMGYDMMRNPCKLKIYLQLK
ncbi:uncharacterized protein LOC108743690 isoform X2 [Agrilus planipennis]|uniref:Uncharacterized protein LOC108743690 isoform X2 n=1 Tax=Agrilus planipennis TaxID=224129 RepID=A0A1W4XF63_AGRPL|nr:uncharacterized protein LOC108743690 isoform X2 [Agrilus planipennis]